MCRFGCRGVQCSGLAAGKKNSHPSYPRRGASESESEISAGLLLAADCWLSVRSSALLCHGSYRSIGTRHHRNNTTQQKHTAHSNTRVRTAQQRSARRESLPRTPKRSKQGKTVLAWLCGRPACFQDSSSRLGEGPRPSDFLAACRDIRTSPSVAVFAGRGSLPPPPRGGRMHWSTARGCRGAALSWTACDGLPSLSGGRRCGARSFSLSLVCV